MNRISVQDSLSSISSLSKLLKWDNNQIPQGIFLSMFNIIRKKTDIICTSESETGHSNKASSPIEIASRPYHPDPVFNAFQAISLAVSKCIEECPSGHLKGDMWGPFASAMHKLARTNESP
jgi:hypothetical protein